MLCLKCKSTKLFQYKSNFLDSNNDPNTIYKWKCLDCGHEFKEKDLKFIPMYKFNDSGFPNIDKLKNNKNRKY